MDYLFGRIISILSVSHYFRALKGFEYSFNRLLPSTKELQNYVLTYV